MRATLIIFLITMLSQTVLVAQKNLNSPFSRYGLGLESNSFVGNQFALGDIGAALNDPTRINYNNPASYSFLKNTSSEFSLKTSYNSISDNSTQINNFNGHIGGFALGFPMGEHFGAAFGFSPRYKNGYLIQRTSQLSNQDTITNEGLGGINEAFVGISYELKGFSIGANLNYNFGQLNQIRSIYYASDDLNNLKVEDRLNLFDFSYDFGIQYQSPELWKGWNVVVGVAASPETALKSFREEVAYNYVTVGGIDYTQDTVNSNINEPTEGNTLMPQNLSSGITFQKGQRWLIGFEYEQTAYSRLSIIGENLGLRDAYSFKSGIQYSPLDRIERRDKNINGFAKRMVYRAGFRYHSTYMTLNNNPVDEFGINFGVDIPAFSKFNPVISYINFGLEIGKMGNLSQNNLSESFIKFNLSYTFNDVWFQKAKID